jgi:uncharacterized membrane protein HdeD (DUF308 family)
LSGVRVTESADKGIAYFLAKNWWLTLIRGLAALGLGVGLFAWPESTLDSMLRFMALYWLSSGLMSLMQAVHGDRRGRGFFFITGMVGILGGLFVLLHSLFEATVSFTLLASMFGTVAILTGLLHMLAGFRTSATAGREWSWGSFFLGIIEVVMGLIVISSPGNPSKITFMVASIWALIGGGGLIADSIQLRRRWRAMREAAQPDTC